MEKEIIKKPNYDKVLNEKINAIVEKDNQILEKDNIIKDQQDKIKKKLMKISIISKKRFYKKEFLMLF